MSRGIIFEHRESPRYQTQAYILEKQLLNLWSNKSYKQRDQDIGEKMQAESLGSELYDVLVGASTSQSNALLIKENDYERNEGRRNFYNKKF